MNIQASGCVRKRDQTSSIPFCQKLRHTKELRVCLYCVWISALEIQVHCSYVELSANRCFVGHSKAITGIKLYKFLKPFGAFNINVPY